MANFYLQCEKLINSLREKPFVEADQLNNNHLTDSVAVPNVKFLNSANEKSEILIIANDPNKEKMNNSVKVNLKSSFHFHKWF